MKQENKINIAELLKDCPQGMELYSPIFGEVYLDEIRPHLAIVVTTDKEQGDIKEEFLYDGRYGINGECMLYPSKSRTTWEGFQRPFKDGDIVVGKNCACSYITIFKEFIDNISFSNYVCLTSFGSFKVDNFSDNANLRFATDEEKQKLFDAIKANDYKWNFETKTLEKLVKPKFKVGDVIQDIDTYKVKITEVSIEDECYEYESMYIKGIGSIGFSEQDNWELIPNKFDINTLKPFDKVLVRDGNKDKWNISFYGFYDIKYDIKYPYECCGNSFAQCIPYEGNEHLLGTTNDCDEFYKNW